MLSVLAIRVLDRLKIEAFWNGTASRAPRAIAKTLRPT